MGVYLLKEEEVEEGGMVVAALMLSLLVLPWMRCKAAWRWLCAGRAVAFFGCCCFNIVDDDVEVEGSKKAWVDRDKMERETQEKEARSFILLWKALSGCCEFVVVCEFMCARNSFGADVHSRCRSAF